jgi:hypothetical protein
MRGRGCGFLSTRPVPPPPPKHLTRAPIPSPAPGQRRQPLPGPSRNAVAPLPAPPSRRHARLRPSIRRRRQLSYVRGGVAQWVNAGLEMEEGPDGGAPIEDLAAAGAAAGAGAPRGGLQLGGWKLELPIPAALLGRQ